MGRFSPSIALSKIIKRGRERKGVRYSTQNGFDIQCSFCVLHDRFAIQTELIHGNWIFNLAQSNIRKYLLNYSVVKQSLVTYCLLLTMYWPVRRSYDTSDWVIKSIKNEELDNSFIDIRNWKSRSFHAFRFTLFTFTVVFYMMLINS